MAKEITVNALGENVKIAIPDFDSFDDEYYVDLPQGFSLHYEAEYPYMDDDSLIEVNAIISDKNGNNLSEYKDGRISVFDFEKRVESLTRDAVGNIENDVKSALKDAQRTIDTYEDIKFPESSVKGPGE